MISNATAHQHVQTAFPAPVQTVFPAPPQPKPSSNLQAGDILWGKIHFKGDEFLPGAPQHVHSLMACLLEIRNDPKETPVAYAEDIRAQIHFTGWTNIPSVVTPLPWLKSPHDSISIGVGCIAQLIIAVESSPNVWTALRQTRDGSSYDRLPFGVVFDFPQSSGPLQIKLFDSHKGTILATFDYVWEWDGKERPFIYPKKFAAGS